MIELGNKIAKKRKDLGMTQIDFADKLSVTRQTVSRWESGAVMPDIDKIGDIASILGVSCDYLLKDDITEDGGQAQGGQSQDSQTQGGQSRGRNPGGLSRLLSRAVGKKVKLNFFDDEGDIDLYNADCTILEFEGNWMKVAAETKKGRIEKLIPVASILSLEIREEA